ncbi:MAG: hypothetical protein RLZZ528_2496 [Pseudomonadota bacterium]
MTGTVSAKLGQKSVAMMVLVLLQAGAALFFIADVIDDIRDPNNTYTWFHLYAEIGANIALVLGVVFQARYLLKLLDRQADTDRALSVASGALSDVIEAYFREWNLTRSEADIALFTIKGYSIAEIAKLRGSAEGTIKTHLNAIYRKAGVAGRAQLVSLLIEDLMDGKLVEGGAPVGGKADPGVISA